ncbi:MAG: hypothetical protein EBS77_00665 [Gammaproteobacteria bacterium]|nr:hypothetical protein [Gammaproteobacteria bacterium]
MPLGVPTRLADALLQPLPLPPSLFPAAVASPVPLQPPHEPAVLAPFALRAPLEPLAHAPTLPQPFDAPPRLVLLGRHDLLPPVLRAGHRAPLVPLHVARPGLSLQRLAALPQLSLPLQPSLTPLLFQLQRAFSQRLPFPFVLPPVLLQPRDALARLLLFSWPPQPQQPPSPSP